MASQDAATRPAGRFSRALLAALAGLALAGALVARGAVSGSAPDPADGVGRALDAALVARGVDRAAVVARPAAGGPERRAPAMLTVELPGPATYADVNREIARAVSAAGGRVVDAVERGTFPERPESLDLYVGTSREITHRVTLRPERPFGAGEAEAPRIAIVFDDLGYTTGGLAGELLAIDAPITFAVLPGLARSAAFVEAARARGHEVLLHLPMEPLDPERHDPGRGAVRLDLPPAENVRRVAACLDALGDYAGVSNHMGSRATATPEVMDLVLGEMKRRGGLFFLDSRTTPFSVVPERARRAGVPFACNNVFLDGTDEDAALAEVQTERLEAIARRRGHAIGIGHVRPETIAAVRAAAERWRGAGIRLVRVSELQQAAPAASSNGMFARR